MTTRPELHVGRLHLQSALPSQMLGAAPPSIISRHRVLLIGQVVLFGTVHRHVVQELRLGRGLR